MPSPFPGMDPYLESPRLWPDVHHELISVIRERLNAALKPRYVSRVEERIYISDENDPGRSTLIPDVAIQIASASSPYDRSGLSDGTVAVAEPIVATTLIEEEIREARVVIVDAAGRQVVTVIEVLSPTNKIVGSRGRTNYEAKRLEVMHSPAHFVEIDFLREGMPIYAAQRLPPHDYLVHVSRCGERPQGVLWPILLTQRLPTIKIPLLANDPDADLDLGAVLNSAYDRAGYEMSINYKEPPEVALSGESAKWAQAWLARAAIREP
jgi:Protein of unknown function (DUF4058)